MGFRAPQGWNSLLCRGSTLAGLLFLGVIGPVAPAWALDISELKSDGLCRGLVLDGRIARDEAAGFVAGLVAAADRCGTRILVIGRMPGGSVKDALEIGTAVRAHEYVTAMRPGSVCASACGLIYLGGVQRYWRPGATFVIHRPEIMTTMPFRSVAESERAYEALRARLIRYVAAMGGSPDYVDLMYAAGDGQGGGMRILQRVDLMRLGLFTHTDAPF